MFRENLPDENWELFLKLSINLIQSAIDLIKFLFS